MGQWTPNFEWVTDGWERYDLGGETIYEVDKSMCLWGEAETVSNSGDDTH